MKKITPLILIVVVIAMVLLWQQNSRMQSQLEDQSAQLKDLQEDVENLPTESETPDTTSVQEPTSQESTTEDSAKEEEALFDKEDTPSDEEETPSEETFVNYDTALTNAETLESVVALYRLDLSETQFAAYGYKVHEFYKELGTEAFIVRLAATGNTTINEAVIETLVADMILNDQMEWPLDLETYKSELDQFIRDKERTVEELRIAYNLRAQINRI